MQRLTVCLATAATLAMGGVAQTALAQSYMGTQTSILENFDRGRNVSVLQRDRPEYAAQGIPFGGFTAFPKVTLGAGWNSNVFATKSNAVSDGFYTVDPRVDIYSNWARNQLQASAAVDWKRLFEQTSEDETNWTVDASGRLDVVGDSSIQGGAQVKRLHLERSDIGFPAGASRLVPVTATNIFVRPVYQANRLRWTGLAVFDRRDYSNVPRVGGGVVEQNSRDVDTYSLTGRADYAVSPSTALFAQAAYSNSKYTTTGVFDRNSHDDTGLVGANFDISAVARGEIGVGYTSRSYDNGQFKSIKGASFNAQVEYFPTQLTTITATAQRSIQDSILANTGGYLSTSGSLRVDHELLRNLLLAASASAEDDDFRGAERKDRIYTATASANYLLSQTIGVAATLSYNSRNSSGAAKGPEFDDTQLSVSLVLQR